MLLLRERCITAKPVRGEAKFYGLGRLAGEVLCHRPFVRNCSKSRQHLNLAENGGSISADEAISSNNMTILTNPQNQ